MHARSSVPIRRVRRRDILRAALTAVGGWVGTAGLAGCAGRTSRPAGTGNGLTFVDIGSGGEQDRMTRILADFQKSGGPAVTLVPISNYYTQNVQAMVAAGQTPDALYVSRAEFDALWPSDRLADLKPFLKDPSPFYPILLQEWQRKDRQLALPLGFRTLGLAYNTGQFQTNQLQPPPSDWNAGGWSMGDFAAAATKLSRPASAENAAQYGFYADTTYLVWSAFIYNNGGTVINDQARTVDVDQPPAVAALGTLQQLVTKPGVMPPQDLVAADQGLNIFSNGDLGMTITDPSTIPERKRDAHFPWDIAVLPGGGGSRSTTGTGAGYALLAGSKRQDQAWKLVEYLTDEARQRGYARSGQWIPSRQKVATSTSFLTEMENVDVSPQHKKTFVDALGGTTVRLEPPLANWPAIRGALEAGIQDLWSGKLKPEEAAAQMKKIAEPIVKQG